MQKPHIPYHCIWKILRKAFRTHASSFWLFLLVFSKCFTAVLHVIGHDSKAAQCVPLHLELQKNCIWPPRSLVFAALTPETVEKLHFAAAMPSICSILAAFNA